MQLLKKLHLLNMKLLYLLLLSLPQLGHAQNSFSCYEFSDIYSYSAYESITLYDSTFEYDFYAGLAGGTVQGKYKKFGDTLVLTSNHQSTDYHTYSKVDATIPQGELLLQIKYLRFTQVLNVVKTESKDSSTYFKGQRHSPSLPPSIHSFPDTIVDGYNISTSELMNNSLEIIVWRKRKRIKIPLTENHNYYELDLTHYPKALDYRFFDGTYAIVKDEKLCFLETNLKPEKTHFFMKRGKRLKLSKRKRVKWFLACKPKSNQTTSTLH